MDGGLLERERGLSRGWGEGSDGAESRCTT